MYITIVLTGVFSLTCIISGACITGFLLFTSIIVMLTATAVCFWLSPGAPSNAITFKLYNVFLGCVKSGSRDAPRATDINPLSASIINLSEAPLWMRYTI